MTRAKMCSSRSACDQGLRYHLEVIDSIQLRSSCWKEGGLWWGGLGGRGEEMIVNCLGEVSPNPKDACVSFSENFPMQHHHCWYPGEKRKKKNIDERENFVFAFLRHPPCPFRFPASIE